MKNSVAAALACGAMVLASQSFAQDTNSASSTSAAPERVIVTRQVTPSTRGVDIARLRVGPVSPATYNGGVGGSIGGYYINGATPADNLPLPGGAWPIR